MPCFCGIRGTKVLLRSLGSSIEINYRYGRIRSRRSVRIVDRDDISKMSHGSRKTIGGSSYGSRDAIADEVTEKFGREVSDYVEMWGKGNRFAVHLYDLRLRKADYMLTSADHAIVSPDFRELCFTLRRSIEGNKSQSCGRQINGKNDLGGRK